MCYNIYNNNSNSNKIGKLTSIGLKLFTVCCTIGKHFMPISVIFINVLLFHCIQQVSRVMCLLFIYSLYGEERETIDCILTLVFGDILILCQLLFRNCRVTHCSFSFCVWFFLLTRVMYTRPSSSMKSLTCVFFFGSPEKKNDWNQAQQRRVTIQFFLCKKKACKQ